MKTKRSSGSAAGVALIRAVEAERPVSERVCFDPYARAFGRGVAAALARWMIASRLYEWLAPGATAFVAVRERYIDDCVTKALAEGLDQVVILGAGFDTRAYRIKGIERARVFEVDHPATQAVKAAKLHGILAALPSHVTFVPVDFETDTLEERLSASGFDERAKTYFIWQGVTYFLTKEGVDRTLSFIANHSGAGSAVIFDYFYEEKLRTEAKALGRASRVSGERYLFGIERGSVGSFLAQRGFYDVLDVPMEELRRRYCAGSNAARNVPKGIAIASAVVRTVCPVRA